MNPFTPPLAVDLPTFASLTDEELVSRMIDDRESAHAVHGFSALLGSQLKRKLAGSNADRLIENNFRPEIYQATRWWCLGFIPIVPLGTYAVVSHARIDRPFSDEHSRSFRVATDWFQVIAHIVIGLSIVLAIAMATIMALSA